MTVTVIGEDLHQIRQKIGAFYSSRHIEIQWRNESLSFDMPKSGCTIDATGMGEEVKRVFDSTPAAMAYLKQLFAQRDAFVKKRNLERKVSLNAARGSATKRKEKK